jgi:hypothetical protein
MEIDMEKRKSEILDRLATEILEKELAEERERVLQEEKRIAYEQQQKEIFSQMESILPEILELECKKFPEFMLEIGEIFRGLAARYDELEAEMSAKITDFRSARSRYNNENEVSNLFNEVSKDWHATELPEDLMKLLNFSFGNRDVQMFCSSWSIIRFLDFRHRGPLGMSELNSKLKKR